MLTKNYILECLDSYGNFNQLSEDNFYNQIVEVIQNQQCFAGYDWTWNNGVSKGVLIFKDLDFVIKIPFVGRESYTESHYETARGCWVWPGSKRWESDKVQKFEAEYEFWEFEGAHSKECDWDYCAVEKELHKSAMKEGLEKCFAATTLLGYAQDHPIYIQEKCCIFGEESTESKESKYKNRTSSDYQSLKEFREKNKCWLLDNDWVLDFIIYWGEQVFEKLWDFIVANDIDDLHDGNIGYRNGVPCIIDYSNFND